MPTTVVKTIGSGRDYSTIQAWEDACPANLVTNDEIWRGEMYAEGGGTNGEWTVNTTVLFSGTTTDSTRYLELTTASGSSFADNANKLTNALRYNNANGVAIVATAGYQAGILEFADTVDVRISRLQFRRADAGGTNFMLYNGGSSSGYRHRVRDCIFDQEDQSVALRLNSCELVNVLIYSAATSAAAIRITDTAARFINCTVYTAGAAALDIAYPGAAHLIRNCAFFGVGSIINSTTGLDAACGYNATNLSSVGFGSNNVVSLTTTDQFQSVTSGSEDFRTKTGHGLGAGLRDQTYTNDLDIVGQSRSTTLPTIGVWESIVAGAPIFSFQGNAFQFGQYIPGAAGSGVNGTLSSTLDNFTAAGLGKVEVRGTGANNAIANVTAAGLGKVEIKGTGVANTIANVTAAGLGTVLITGVGANNTIDNFTLAGVGSLGTSINGALDVTIDNVTAAGLGKVEVKGTGANNTIGAITAAGLGTVLIQGTGANNTIGNFTSAGLGTVLVQGTGANNVIGSFTLAGLGTVLIKGTGANNTIDNVTVAGAGVLGAPVIGTLNVTLDNVTVSALGNVAVQGTGASTIAAFTAAGLGKVEVKGTTSATIDPVTVVAVGSRENRGTLSVTVGDFTVAGLGSVRIAGTLNKTIDAVTLAATGLRELRGTTAVTIGPVTAVGTGVVGAYISGSLNKSIGIFTVTATAAIQDTIRSLGASVQQGGLGGGLQRQAYSKSRFRQENMKWPTKG